MKGKRIGNVVCAKIDMDLQTVYSIYPLFNASSYIREMYMCITRFNKLIKRRKAIG